MKNSTLSGTGLPKRNLFVEIIASLLLIFFVHTLISSYIQLQSLKNLLAFYTRHSTTVAWLILSVETLTATLLFIPRTRLIGFTVVLLFCIYAGYIVLENPHYPHDFGGMLNSLTGRKQLLLYSFQIILSVAGIVSIIFQRKQPIAPIPEPVVFT